MNPGFSLGFFRVNYYGLILGLAIVTAYLFARWRAKNNVFPLVVLDNMFLLSVPLGIIFARIYFVVFSWSQYAQDPKAIFFIWQGGLAIHGALLGGLLGAWLAVLWARRNKIKVSLIKLLDLLAPSLLLGQAIGRLGNFINQEAFGSATKLPWGIFIPENKRPLELINETNFHPTFAYEAIWNILGLAIILFIEKRHHLKSKQGVVFALYLAWYSVGRFFIESLRTDSLYWGNLRVAQIVSVLLLVGAITYIWYANKDKNAQKYQR